MTARLLDLAEAADRIGMSREWLRKQVTAQLVECTRFGRSVRFTEDQIARIIAAHTQPAAPAIGPVRRAHLTALPTASSPRPSGPPPTPPPPPRPTAPPKATTRKASA